MPMLKPESSRLVCCSSRIPSAIVLVRCEECRSGGSSVWGHKRCTLAVRHWTSSASPASQEAAPAARSGTRSVNKIVRQLEVLDCIQTTSKSVSRGLCFINLAITVNKLVIHFCYLISINIKDTKQIRMMAKVRVPYNNNENSSDSRWKYKTRSVHRMLMMKAM